jgi:hypothetical protein
MDQPGMLQIPRRFFSCAIQPLLPVNLVLIADVYGTNVKKAIIHFPMYAISLEAYALILCFDDHVIVMSSSDVKNKKWTLNCLLLIISTL